MEKELKKILQIIDEEPKRFESQIPEVEKKIFRDVSLLLKDLKVSANGKIEANIGNLKLINEIKNRLGKIVVSKQYASLVNKFVSHIPAISNFQTSTAGLPAASKKMMSAVAKVQIDNTLESLIGQGYKQSVVSKLYNTLLTNVTSGGSYSDMIEQLEKQLITTEEKPGMLSKYAKTYVVDTLGQFAGQGNKMVADALESEWFQYVGSNLTTTREFCEHLTKKRYVHISEFPAILKGKIDGHQCKIYEATGLPYGMKEGTNADNFIENRGGWNCGHQLHPVNEALVPKEIREKMELKAGLKKLDEIDRNGNSGVLYSDITGGIATKLIDIVNKNLNNKQKSEILTEITQNKGFNEISKNTEKGTTTKVFGTVKDTDIEYADNLNAARSLNKNGYDVYMLPKLTGSKSPDYILSKNNKVYTAELKTIYGKNSIDHRLNKANEQSERVILNIVGNITSRNAANAIKDFYLDNPQIKEVKVLLGGKGIDIRYGEVKDKKFIDNFMKRWSR